MPVDKDKLFQEFFNVFKKSHGGMAPGKVQKLCVEEWRQIGKKYPSKTDESAFESEVKAVMAREQAKVRSGSIMKFLSKVRINVNGRQILQPCVNILGYVAPLAFCLFRGTGGFPACTLS